MMMGLLGTIVLNATLGLGAYWTARHGFRQPAGLTRALAAVTLAWTWATVGLEILGALGALGLTSLLIWSALGLGIGRVLRAWDDQPEWVEAADPPGQAWSWESVVALGLTIWGGLFHGVQSLLWPVKVISDGPIYHLYFAARWWKEGSLRLIATPFGENAAPYFPAVGDLWFTWLMVGWGGERLAKVGQAPFWGVSGLAAYALARRLGAGSSAALIATTWFLTSTPLLLFAFEANVDMIFVAGYLLAASFFVRYHLGDVRGSTLALGTLAAGGALGSKTIGVVFVPVLLGLAGLAVWRRPGPFLDRAIHLVLVLTLPLVMAGFWYGRNLWLTGNPLYPLHLAVGGRVWLSGWYDRVAMRTSPYYLPVEDWRSLWDVVMGVIDPHFAPFWFAALLGLWSLRTRGTERAVDLCVWICSLLAILNVGLYWLLIPYRTQQRFMLHAVGLAVVPLARLLDRSRWLRMTALGLLVIHLLMSQNWPFASGSAPWDLSRWIPDVTSGIFFMPQMALMRQGRSESSRLIGLAAIALLGVGSLGVAWAWSRVGGSPARWLRAVFASLGLFGIACGVFFPYDLDPRRRFHPVFPDYYLGWLDLETRVGASGAKIAYAGTNIPFYLMGAGLRNEVRYVNVDGRRSWLLHDYHREARANGKPTWPDSRPGWDRLHPDYAGWLAALHDEQIQILVVAKANPDEGRHNIADAEQFPIERTWADTHPESFFPLYGVVEGDPRMRIYRVRAARQ
ncbi:4-amino-4-deoxy-L-arabinose transferase [Singulisphaera sp. GP187]|uniref:4-amino-4-deoxy-L-arabinose transferase n=1 Tax=Singulisphaera sp. GP187 TaxID=1882752 RepID=UPI00092BC0D3|nr:4-amino-4-deoxy-L-arabinose transferase [Singulisphaera sp. GP187]SIO59924.1 4-amino-4-deoxy-L-arabinose transferase [Singulisphaera sp. GP187]